MAVTLLILGSILMGVAIVLAFLPRTWSVVAGWVSLLCFHYAFTDMIGWPTIIFWGIAAALVMGIDFLSPMAGRPPRAANAYITAGAMVGSIVGMVIAQAGLIIGAVVGAFFGALAYSRTPRGRSVTFPSPTFWRLLLYLGLPAVVVMSILGQIYLALLIPV